MNVINVTMTDDFTGETVERQIDISNFSIKSNFPNISEQEAILNEWIISRANHQHDTSLTLESWNIQ